VIRCRCGSDGLSPFLPLCLVDICFTVVKDLGLRRVMPIFVGLRAVK
jgi:hypothetical protein